MNKILYRKCCDLVAFAFERVGVSMSWGEYCTCVDGIYRSRGEEQIDKDLAKLKKEREGERNAVCQHCKTPYKLNDDGTCDRCITITNLARKAQAAGMGVGERDIRNALEVFETERPAGPI